MKTLTLTQPWAQIIAISAKKIETRSWSSSYRGPLAIHAAKGFPKWAKETCGEPLFHEALYAGGYEIGLKSSEILPIGAVIATCQLVDVRSTDKIHYRTGEAYWDGPDGKHLNLSFQEQKFGDYGRGRFAWVLDDIKPITPVQAKGALGLWEWEP